MRALYYLVLLIIIGIGAVGVLTHVVPAHAIGAVGTQNAVGPGLYFTLPFRDTWRERSKKGRLIVGHPDAQVKTQDATVQLGIVVDYTLQIGQPLPTDDTMRAKVIAAVSAELATHPQAALQGDAITRVSHAIQQRLAKNQWRVDQLTLSSIRLADETTAQADQMAAIKTKANQGLEAEAQARRAVAKALSAVEQTVAQTEAQWDVKDANARTESALQIATLEADANLSARIKRAEADAEHLRQLAIVQAEVVQLTAVNEAQRIEALKGEGGRWLLAIESARRFQLGDIVLSSDDPDFFRRFGSPAAWRAFFLGE